MVVNVSPKLKITRTNAPDYMKTELLLIWPSLQRAAWGVVAPRACLPDDRQKFAQKNSEGGQPVLNNPVPHSHHSQVTLLIIQQKGTSLGYLPFVL